MLWPELYGATIQGQTQTEGESLRHELSKRKQTTSSRLMCPFVSILAKADTATDKESTSERRCLDQALKM
jgi:hypothetical protein